MPCRLAALAAWACVVGVAEAQTAFKDDAGRSVVLPASVDRVFAAGAPAEILLYTLVPEKLAGRNHQPPEAALRRPLTLHEIRERAPDVVIAASASAAAARHGRRFQPLRPGMFTRRPTCRSTGGRGRLRSRLPGLIWLAYAARRKPFDDEFRADVSRVFAAFYHVTPADAQLEQLIAVLGAARLRSDVVLAQEER